MVRIIAAVLSLTVICAASQADDAATVASGAAEFIAAMQRTRTNVPEPADSVALKAYPIYDYLIAARMRRDLSGTATEQLDTSIDDFLRAHEGLPVTRTLRHQWLVSLAQRGRWEWFLPRSTDVTDAALICDRLTGRLATHDLDRLGTEALARWSMPQRQPPECAPIFGWLRAQGLVTPMLQETRARAALAADNASLAREFIAEVPAERAPPLAQWLQLLESPAAAISRLAAVPSTAVEPDALVAGFTRLSNSDPANATSVLPALMARADLSADVRAKLQRALALGDAYARQPGAVPAFEQLPRDVLDPQVQEWRARAALWAGNFDKAAEWIERMPPALAAQPRWRYWRARAIGANGGTEAAALYAEIASSRDYYGYLAADRIHRAYDLNIRPTPDDAALQALLAAEPGLIRAHALFDCDMTDDAVAEWSAALAASPPPLKVQAAHLASRWGWYAQAIATLAQADNWDDVPMRYPRPFTGVIADASKLTQVPADWILAVIRQESLFRKDALSRADARGLMQMQPATATAVAKRWRFPVPSRDSLFDPQTAVPLGAAYLHELLDRYGNQLDLSLAAYNAGPLSVARWMPSRPIDADIWIENIPYTETRGYVQHILEHIVAFAVVRDAEPPRLSSLLPPVQPAAPVASAAP